MPPTLSASSSELSWFMSTIPSQIHPDPGPISQFYNSTILDPGPFASHLERLLQRAILVHVDRLDGLATCEDDGVILVDRLA